VTPPGEAALVTSVEYSESVRYESTNEPALMRSVAKFEFEFSTRFLGPRELKKGIASRRHLEVKERTLPTSTLVSGHFPRQHGKKSYNQPPLSIV
jgi:hypothetical protein